jgi:hypothetical protein
VPDAINVSLSNRGNRGNRRPLNKRGVLPREDERRIAAASFMFFAANTCFYLRTLESCPEPHVVMDYHPARSADGAPQQILKYSTTHY